MKQPNSRIIVAVNMAQKNELTIGEIVFKTAMKYEVNYREKSPVIAQVVSGNNILKEGNILLCHHNHFYAEQGRQSPYFIGENLFSIPFNKTIFAVLSYQGEIDPVCGNVLGERVLKDYAIPVPNPEYCTDRLKVTHGGWTKFNAGDLIFTRPSAPYEIVYIVDQVEKRICKVSEDMIVGVEKKYYTQ